MSDKLTDLPHLGQFKALAEGVDNGFTPFRRDVIALLRAYSAVVSERDTLCTQLDNAVFMRGIAEMGMATAIEQTNLALDEVERCHNNARDAKCPGLVKNCPAPVAALLAARKETT